MATNSPKNRAGLKASSRKKVSSLARKAIKDDKQKGAGSPDQGKIADEPGKVKNESAPASQSKLLRSPRAQGCLLLNGTSVMSVSPWTWSNG
jgi:hypothetical protein